MKSFIKQLIFISLGVVILVAGGFAIYAIGDKGAAPVGWWKFNEGSGNYAYDSSGNANTGSLVLGGSATSSAWVAGAYGTALSFDGVNDYVDIPDPVLGSTAMTVCAWVKKTAYTQYQGIISDYSAPDGIRNFSLGYENPENTIRFYVGTTGADVDSQSITGFTANTWHFVCGVFDGTQDLLRIHLDSNYQSKTTSVNNIGSTLSPTGYHAIGKYGGSYEFNGLIDDIRIYNYARTADQIRADYNNGKALYVGSRAAASCDVDPASCVNQGLVGHWDMEAKGGLLIIDNSGNGNTGTLTNGPTWTKGVQPFSGGKAGGGALQFDGVNDYVDVPNSGTLSVSAMTVGLWIKTTDTAGDIASKYNGGTASWRLMLSGGLLTGVIYDTNGDNRNPVSGIGTINDGVWHYVTMTFSGTIARLYLDGVQQQTFNSALGMLAGTANVNIGYGYSGQGYTGGIIDDVRIYNRALSATEIQYQYNQGRPIAQWKFDEQSWNGTASEVKDSIGNPSAGSGQAHGTSANGANTTSTAVFGRAGSFDGSDDYVDAGSGASLATTIWSIGAWVKPNSHTNNPFIFVKGNTNITTNYYLQLLSTNTVESGFYSGGNWRYVDTTATISTEVWSYLFGTFDGTYVKIYINGVLKATSANFSAYTPPTGATSLKIGADYGPNATYYFNGLIDDVRIFNYALTADQVRREYDAGKAIYVGGSFKNGKNCDTSPADCVNDGLVGYWDMEAKGGLLIIDNSGNGNTGTLGGGVAAARPTWTKGVQPFSGGKAGGGALSFDGVDDYVDVGNGASLLSNVGTYEFWYIPTYAYNGGSAYTTLIAKEDNDIRINYDRASAKFYFKVDAVSYLQNTAQTFSAGTPLHIVWTYDYPNQTYKFYLNGVLDKTTTGVGTFSDVLGNNLFIGKDKASSYFCAGKIDDVRIYNRALSASEIQYQYNQGRPIAWWKMDEGADSPAGEPLTCNATISSVYDYSGNPSAGSGQANGTLYLGGSPATSTAWSDGKYNCALSFDGSNDYVATVDMASVDGATALTVSAWVKANTWTDNIGVVEKGDVFILGKHSSFGTGKGAFGVVSGGVMKYAELPSALSTGYWHHLEGVYDGARVNIYLDGIKTQGDSLTGAIASSAALVNIGGRGGGSFQFDGLIDDVRIYNYARTADQIRLDYTAGSALHLGN